MNKEVLISIKGLHFESDPTENIEIITVGEHYKVDNKYFIRYEELLEDTGDIVKCTIKIKKDSVEMIKKGLVDVNLTFEEKKKNISYYNTPYGMLLIGIYASKIEMEEQEDSIDVNIAYSLEINNQHISDCDIYINIKSKENAKLQLKMDK